MAVLVIMDHLQGVIYDEGRGKTPPFLFLLPLFPGLQQLFWRSFMAAQRIS